MEPTFSIIIPTYGRPQQLGECLAGVAALAYPRDRYEVIVVDDGSPAPLEHVLAPFDELLHLRLLRKANGGPASARKAGAGGARGHYLAFTDDDCVPAPDWLQALAARFKDTPTCLIGGRTRNRLRQNPYATTSQIIVDAAYAYYNRPPHDAHFFTANNLAVSAELFRQVGGFRQDFRIAAEDREICDRWRYMGYQLTYAPEAVVFHAHPLTLHSFCKQHFNYGRGAWLFHQVRAHRGSGRFRHALQFHAHFLWLLRRSLPRLSLAQAMAVGVLLGLWQCANAVGFLYELCRHRRSAWP